MKSSKILTKGLSILAAVGLFAGCKTAAPQSYEMRVRYMTAEEMGDLDNVCRRDHVVPAPIKSKNGTGHVEWIESFRLPDPVVLSVDTTNGATEVYASWVQTDGKGKRRIFNVLVPPPVEKREAGLVR